MRSRQPSSAASRAHSELLSAGSSWESPSTLPVPTWSGGDLQLAVAFLIIVAVLVVRPQGLLGRPNRQAGLKSGVASPPRPPSLLACAGCRGSPARPSTFVTSFQSSQWTQVLIFTIAIMGLNVLVGYSGQISLGHGAFMALGAYASAILITRYHVNYFVTIPIAGLITGVIALFSASSTAALRPVPRPRDLRTRCDNAKPDQAAGTAHRRSPGHSSFPRPIRLSSPRMPSAAVTNGPHMTSEQCFTTSASELALCSSGLHGT